MRLLVTRPRADAEAQAEKLAALGHEALVEPLMKLEHLDPGPLPLAGAQALLATSRNALRVLKRLPGKDNALSLPLLAVGGATAQTARAMGFSRVAEAGGTARELVTLTLSACLPEKGPLVHLAGERLAQDVKGDLENAGFRVEQPVLYRMIPREKLSHGARAAIAGGEVGGVILMSPETARTWLRLVRADGLERRAGGMAHFCLSESIAEALEGLGGERVCAPPAPVEDDLLALIAREAAD